MVAEEPLQDGQQVIALQFRVWTRGLKLLIVKLGMLRNATQFLSLNAVVNTVMNLRIPQKAGNILNNGVTLGF
jgi:hypothetical protein